MCNFVFIRHGKTYGNTLHRYIGTTDEVLLDEAIFELKKNTYPSIDILITSPLKRCIQTCEIIYPNMYYTIENNLKECNFGDYENKSHNDLKDIESYNDFLNMGENAVYPNGEGLKEFKERCVKTFNKYINLYKNSNKTVAFIFHGGVIMSILHYYFSGNFYDYNLKNGNYYTFSVSDDEKFYDLKIGE